LIEFNSTFTDKGGYDLNQAFLVWRGITYTYIHKKDHRDKTPEKSQWTISELEEQSCFVHGIQKNWNNKSKFVSWGLHLDHLGKVVYLGITAPNEPEAQELFFAKFIDSSKNNCWHGYPANHRKQQDIPPEEVLNDWMENKYLPPAKIRKILKGQPCKL